MRHAFKCLLLAGLVAVPSAAVGQSPESSKQKLKAADKPVVVPFELLSSRHMAVKVKINGKGPYRLIFDTGAPMNLINNKIAKDAGVIDAKTKKPGFGLFGVMGQHELKSLEVGGAKIEKIPTMVMDHPTVAAISEVLGPIEGIIGFPFFARYRMTVDYQKKQLTLVPNGYKPGDYMQGLMAKVMNAQDNKDPAVVAPAGLWGLTADKAKDDEDAGVTVKGVLPGGPAAAGGLKTGDRVLTIDGRWTDNVPDLFRAAAAARPGREVVVVVRRGGKELKLTVKPAKGI